MDVLETLKKLTLEEKIALVAGTDFMYTNPIKRLGIKSIRMSDGPHGLRVQNEGGDNGVTGSEVATAFPTAATIANSWNIANSYLMGEAIAREAKHYGIDVVLGPAVNIKRNPLGGRNFEYFSEDPILSGIMGAYEVKGIESLNIGSCVKHFALNNSENYRFMGNSICDIRTIKELYLKSFELVTKLGKPKCIMSAYNKINGIYAGENEELLKKTLREEWGFSGLVMTDWGATHDRVKMLKATCDLEMPGDTKICRKWIYDAIKAGSLKEEVLDAAVLNVLNLINSSESNKVEKADFVANYGVALKLALDSAVLLKNKNAILPLSRNGSYLVIGDLFTEMRYQGSGSSMINPYRLVTPKMAFDNYKINYDFARGYIEATNESNQELLNEAIKKAKKYDKIILFLGLTDLSESEAKDRDDMALPLNQIELVNELIKLDKKIIVILFGGSPIELDFSEKVEAILDMYLPGEAGGEALVKLLLGEVSPSGKLAETWPIKYSDVPSASTFSKGINEIYKEGLLVGYRYYSTAKKEVKYPFGFGLSYTKFSYSDLNVYKKDSNYIVKVKVKNIGDTCGSAVVQIYVEAPTGFVYRPLRELKGFTKVYLEVKEEKEVEIIIPQDYLTYYDVVEEKFVLASGKYIFEIGEDVNNIILSKELLINKEEKQEFDEFNNNYQRGNLSVISDEDYLSYYSLKIEEVKKGIPVTLESRFTELKESFLGNVLYKAVMSVANRQLKKAKKLPMDSERDNKIKGAIFLRRTLESNSLNSMSMCAGKSFPYNFACGFREITNRHLLKGIRYFCSVIKAPKLPKESEGK